MAATRMHNPPHPGEILQDTVLAEDGGVSVTDFAEHLGVSRVTLSRVSTAGRGKRGHGAAPCRRARWVGGIVADHAGGL